VFLFTASNGGGSNGSRRHQPKLHDEVAKQHVTLLPIKHLQLIGHGEDSPPVAALASSYDLSLRKSERVGGTVGRLLPPPPPPPSAGALTIGRSRRLAGGGGRPVFRSQYRLQAVEIYKKNTINRWVLVVLKYIFKNCLKELLFY
jgi:hypothetical protein